MEEVWKDVVGYEGLYQVSNMGRVKSLSRIGLNGNRLKERLLKPRPKAFGYLLVCLYKQGNCKNFLIHRLVAEAFIPNPNNYPQINHKDEVTYNNVVSNLEWCTCKYNINYGSHNERANKSKVNGKGSKAVLQFDLNGNFIKEYPSTSEIGRQLNFVISNISRCCNGLRKTANGYIWKYKNE